MYLYTHITFPCSWVDNILEENPGGTLQTRSRPLASSQLTLKYALGSFLVGQFASNQSSVILTHFKNLQKSLILGPAFCQTFLADWFNATTNH